jgi:hypothetical protein
VLTAAARTTEMRVRGSVESEYRTAYDILVRPRGTQLPLEREQGLVRNNYLSGLFGGISLAEWRRIRAIPGVDVAAPVANVGFILPSGFADFQLNHVLNDDPVQLYRIRYETVAHRGTSRYPLKTDYVYYTRRNPFTRKGLEQNVWERIGGPAGEAVEVCRSQAEASAPGPFSTTQWRQG